jgi:hypothetical protein
MKIALGELCGPVRAQCHGLYRAVVAGYGRYSPECRERRVGTGECPLMAGYLTAVTLWMITA